MLVRVCNKTIKNGSFADKCSFLIRILWLVKSAESLMDIVIVEVVITRTVVHPIRSQFTHTSLMPEANSLTGLPPPHQAVEVTDDMVMPVANEPLSLFRFAPTLQWAQLWRSPPQQTTWVLIPQLLFQIDREYEANVCNMCASIV